SRKISSSLVSIGVISVNTQPFDTHNLKIPNAQVAGVAGLLANTKGHNTCSTHYVTAENQIIEKKYAVVGNAAYTSQAKLMTLEFILNDKRVCVAEQLIIDDSLVQQAFIRIGIQPEPLKKLQTAIENRLQQPTRPDIDTNTKQLLFPIGNGDYHSISPAQNSGLAREFINQLKTINADEHQFINYRSLKVGGTNAINAGVLNVEIGGAHRHLLALTPNVASQKSIDNLLNRMVNNKTIFITRSLNFKTLKEIQDSTENNERIRHDRKAAINVLTQQFLEPTLTLQDYFQDQPEALQSPRFDDITELEKNWLLGHSLSDTDHQQLCDRAEQSLTNLNKNPLLIPELAHFRDFLAQELNQ
ncbi:MAG: type I-F CRISPR-associated protein Csy1, partial [Methylococcaceae bacterium]|nr:type I-F CRISPR-associated protein Csy1 [Methylococcaceae bacterium]